MVNDRVQLLTLEPHFDSDSISSASTYDGASLGYLAGGLQTALPAEEMPSSGAIFWCGADPFRFPPTEPGLLNSIEPAGQEIAIPCDRYDRIAFLGFALGSNFQERLRFIGLEGEQVISFGLSSVYAAQPEFGERAAVRSSGAVVYPKGLVTARPLTIWATAVKCMASEPIARLGLPINPNMRILAITMWRTQREATVQGG